MANGGIDHLLELLRGTDRREARKIGRAKRDRCGRPNLVRSGGLRSAYPALSGIVSPRFRTVASTPE
jgi:hypothetical protein